jgi:tagatose 6-phosphate kinase
MDSKLVVTVTVNPAIDKTYFIHELSAGTLHRVQEVLQLAGGKGLNVARVLHELDVDCAATGFLAGTSGEWIAGQLSATGMREAFVRMRGETRTTLAVVEREGRVTELLEAGPTVPAEAATELMDVVQRLASTAAYATISGSLAPGLPPEYYRSIVTAVQRQGVHACVDTSGPALQNVLEARPYLVKINHHELADWSGQANASAENLRESLQRLQQHCTIALVTAGADGSYAYDGHTFWQVTAPSVNALNPTGSGDAFLAGLVAGLARGESLHQALRVAVAAGASNAAHRGAGEIDVGQVKQLVPQVQVTMQ